MTRVRSLALRLAVVALALAPWVLVSAYAWANTTSVQAGHSSTDWADLAWTLTPPAVGVALFAGLCLVDRRIRHSLRGWPIVWASWLVALGAMVWVGFTTMGF